MAKLLAQASGFLVRSLQAAAGVSVVYGRCDLSATLTAWVGRHPAAAEDGPNRPRVEYGDRDYLFAAADLVLGGAAAAPQKGDRITEVVGGESLTFEVVQPPGEPAYRFSDPGRTIVRVHTKRFKPAGA